MQPSVEYLGSIEVLQILIIGIDCYLIFHGPPHIFLFSKYSNYSCHFIIVNTIVDFSRWELAAMKGHRISLLIFS